MIRFTSVGSVIKRIPEPIRKHTRFWLCRTALLLLVTVVAAASWASYLYSTGNLHALVPGEAYRSGQLTIEQYAHYTKKYGLKSVVNLRGDSKKQWYREEMQAARENNLSHFDYDLSAYQHLKISEMHEILDIPRGEKPQQD